MALLTLQFKDLALKEFELTGQSMTMGREPDNDIIVENLLVSGYHARIDSEIMGRSVSAFIHLTTDSRHYRAVKTLAADMTQITACHHISGDASFIIHVLVDNLSALESVVGRLSPFGQTQTAIVLSTPVDKGATLPLF